MGVVHPQDEIDIARNIKAIEWVKAELVAAVGGLFRGMLVRGEEAILDALAELVILAYLLARRCGFKFERLDIKMENKVRAGSSRNEDLEKWYGDYSALAQYLTQRRRSDPPLMEEGGKEE